MYGKPEPNMFKILPIFLPALPKNSPLFLFILTSLHIIHKSFFSFTADIQRDME